MSAQDVDRVLEDLAPTIARGQMNQAIKRLWEIFDELVDADEISGTRRLIELTHLVAGNRRIKTLEVPAERRAT